MVRRFQRLDAIAGAVLLSASETGGAAPADSRTETDAYEGADADRWIVLGQARAEGDDAGDAFVAADDQQAKGTVGQLVSSLGFRPVDLGGLRMARTLEELAFANISLNATRGWPWQSAFRLVGPQAGA